LDPYDLNCDLEFIAVVGPTASGKSAVAMELACALNGSIVCCDSVQLYEGFDIGSAKPSKNDRAKVPHFLFDDFKWNEECDAAIYAAKARRAIVEIKASNRIPIVTGGTGLYLRALLGHQWDEGLPKDAELRRQLNERESGALYAELQRLDPRRALQLHPNDKFRVVRALEIIKLTGLPVKQSEFSNSLTSKQRIIVMDPPRTELHSDIEKRTKLMIEKGLVAEVEDLINQGVQKTCKPMTSIGYFETVQMLDGLVKSCDLENLIAASTRQYAKRQCTWFQKIERTWTLQAPGQIHDLIAKLVYN
jgi:tRNA dimethylallyltransferase